MKRLFALLLGAPAALFGADDGHPIYVWGHGDKIAEVFKALAQTVDAGSASLTALAFVIGAAIVIFKVVGLQGKPIAATELVKYPLMIIILQQIFLSTTGVPKYIVIDETTEKPYSVGRLPLAIGESFSLFSQMQLSVLSAMDTFFTTPDSISFRSAGLGFGMSVHDSVSTARPLNPSIMATFNAYADNCLANAVFKNPSYQQTLQFSKNLASDMRVIDNYITNYYSPTDGSASVMYCPNVWDKLIVDVSNESQRFLKQLAGSMGYQSNPSNPSAALDGTFGDRVGVVANTFFGMSADAETYVTQSMLANMNNQGVKTLAAMSGINLGAMAFMPAYAERKAQAGFFTTGAMAKKYMPVMQMILTAIVICSSWILVLLAIATTNMRYIYTFFTLLITIILWSVVSSTMNFIFDLWLQDAVKNVAYDITNGSYIIALKDSLDETIGNKLALLGYLSWLTPLIAFALAKGSDVALAGVFTTIGHAFGGAGTAASGAASDRSASGGHSSIGPNGVGYIATDGGLRQMLDHQHTNKSAFNGIGTGFQESLTGSDGNGYTKTSTQYGEWTIDQNGNFVSMSVHGLNSQISNSEIVRQSEAVKLAQSKTQTDQESYQRSWTRGVSDVIADIENGSLSKSTSLSQQDIEATQKAYNVALEKTTAQFNGSESAHSNKTANANSISTTVDARGSVGGNHGIIGGQVNVGTHVEDKRSTEMSDSITNKTGSDFRSSAAFKEALTANFAEQIALNKQTSAAVENVLSVNHSDTYADIQQKQNSYAQSSQESQTAESNLQAMRQFQNNFSGESMTQLANAMRGSGMSGDEISYTLKQHQINGDYAAIGGLMQQHGIGGNSFANAQTSVSGAMPSNTIEQVDVNANPLDTSEAKARIGGTNADQVANITGERGSTKGSLGGGTRTAIQETINAPK
jgi:hypothetical protein